MLFMFSVDTFNRKADQTYTSMFNTNFPVFLR